jgi:hypothetical protein
MWKPLCPLSQDTCIPPLIFKTEIKHKTLFILKGISGLSHPEGKCRSLIPQDSESHVNMLSLYGASLERWGQGTTGRNSQGPFSMCPRACTPCQVAAPVCFLEFLSERFYIPMSTSSSPMTPMPGPNPSSLPAHLQAKPLVLSPQPYH